MLRGEEAVRVLVFWGTVSAAESRVLLAHGVCCAVVCGTALTISRAVTKVFHSSLLFCHSLSLCSIYSSCADLPPKAMCYIFSWTVCFAYWFITIQCTVFALTVHLLLESHAAHWLWNDALFDCQPGEEEIRNGKEWVQKWLSCPPWKLRIVLCSDKQTSFNKILALDTCLVTSQVLIYSRVKNLL